MGHSLSDLGIFTKARSDYADSPMSRLMEVAMRGNAEMAGNAQAKKVASDQMDANAKTSVTVTAPKIPGDEPTLTIKNATPSLVNHTQDQDVQDAHAAPHLAVASALAAPAAPAQPNLAGDPTETYDLIDKTLGYHVPRPNDPDVAEKLKTPQGIRDLTLEMGGTKHHADQAIDAIRRGNLTIDGMRERVTAFRAQRLSAMYEKAVKGPLDESQQIAQRQQAEADRQATESRQKQTQIDTETKSAGARKQALLDKTDLSLIAPDKLEETLKGMSDDEWTPRDLMRARIVQQQHVNKAFADFTGNAEKYALGTYQSWDEAKKAFGHPLNAQQDVQGQAAWKAAHAYSMRKEKDDTAMQALREARLERIRDQIERASAEKPLPLGRADLDLMDADELVNSDPSKIKNYDSALEQKSGLLRKQIRDAGDKRQKAHATIADLQKRAERYGDDVATAGHRVDIAIATRDMDDLTRQKNAVDAARAARKLGSGGRVLSKAEALQRLKQ